MLDTKTEKLLMSKLRQPIHHTYISRYILKTSEEFCKDKRIKIQWLLPNSITNKVITPLLNNLIRLT